MAELSVAVKLCECGCGKQLPEHRKPSRQVSFVRGHHRRRKLDPRPNVELISLFTELRPRPENKAWVYVLWDANREPLYVGKVVRFHYMGRLDEHSHKSPWWGEVAFYSVEEVAVSDVLEAEFQAIRVLRPKHNTASAAECGTLSGYKLHVARQEEACGPCAEASRAHSRERRRKKGVVPPPERPPCGTKGGYEAHLWRGETACEQCRAANTTYYRARRHNVNEGTAARLARPGAYPATSRG